MKKNNKPKKQLFMFDRPKFEIWKAMKKKDREEFDYRFVSNIKLGFVMGLMFMYFAFLLIFFIMTSVDLITSIFILVAALMIIFLIHSINRKNMKSQRKWLKSKGYFI